MMSDDVNGTLGRMYKAFSSVFNSETRGTFFNDNLAFEDADRFSYKNTSSSSPIPSYLQPLFRDKWGHLIPSSVFLQSSISRQGVTFSKRSISEGDSLVIIGSTRQWKACRIVDIIVIPTRHGSDSPYVVAEPYAALSASDKAVDCFRRYPYAGRLVHNRTEGQFLAKASEILCHFAATPVKIAQIKGDCLHVLPLLRVSS